MSTQELVVFGRRGSRDPCWGTGMGLKEAQDNFIKAHRELVREMGHEVDRIAQAMATLDDQLLQQQNSLESKSKAHSQYELDLFRNLQAASKIHDEEVLQISQNMELMHKQKEQLSKSLKLLVQTSLVNLPGASAPSSLLGTSHFMLAYKCAPAAAAAVRLRLRQLIIE